MRNESEPARSRRRSKQAPPDPGKTARNVLSSFNTWSFKREQPTEPDLLLKTIELHVTRGTPVELVLYWGKGPRSRIAPPDVACLDFLATMRARIEGQYAQGTATTLTLTDTPARLNGHAEQAINAYFRDVSEAAWQRGMATVRLSRLVADVNEEEVDIPEIEPQLLQDLRDSAEKWFRGDADSERGAREYFHMNMIERAAIERHFPRAIFLTFNGRQVRQLFPQQMPVFYMYSLRRGQSVKPWFLDANGAPFSNASAIAA